jgi:hypothetical protein
LGETPGQRSIFAIARALSAGCRPFRRRMLAPRLCFLIERMS